MTHTLIFHVAHLMFLSFILGLCVHATQPGRRALVASWISGGLVLACAACTLLWPEAVALPDDFAEFLAFKNLMILLSVLALIAMALCLAHSLKAVKT